MKTPEYIKCPHCEEPIETRRICSICDARIQALINKYPDIFQETVLDKLSPKLDEILSEVNNLKNSIKDFKIRGLKLKSTHI